MTTERVHCDLMDARVIIGATYNNLRVIMRTEHEQMLDKEFMTDEEKSVRRIEEAGVIRSPITTRKLANERLRVAICELTDANIINVQTWLDDIAKNDPAKALDVILRMLEFSVPKLSRVEAHITEAGSSGSLGDLTVRDLQDMVTRARKEDPIDGESEEITDGEFKDLL